MSSTNEICPDKETWCRLCLQEHMDGHTIFAEDDSQLSIPMRLMACLSLEAKPTDGLPRRICGECRYQLEKSFLFRQRSQAADKKLRKHNRLISMGKKSRVFAKSAEQDSDEDEFEESMEFIKKLETLREKGTQKWREKYQQEQEKELLNRLETMRQEIRVEVRKELMEEVRQDVRMQLHEEVQEESRKEQIAKLLSELEIFLTEKKAGHWASVDTSKATSPTQPALPTAAAPPIVAAPVIIPSNPKNEPVVSRKRKRHAKVATASQDAEYVLESATKLEPISTEDMEHITPDNPESFRDLKMVATGDVVTTPNGEIYIINATPKSATTPTSSTEFQQDKNTTSYNIRDNGDIQFTDDKSEDMGDVVVFEVEPAAEDQQVYELDENVIILSNEKSNSEVLTTTKSSKNDYVVKQSPRGSQPVVGRASDTVKSFQCQLCPIAFGTDRSLSRHLTTHIKTIKNGTGGSLKCPVCQLQLSCASSLKRHMIIHTGLKPYKCDECELSFSQREVLKRHMDTHTGAKRHQCPHCTACFAQKTNLQQHVNRMHLDGELRHKCHLCQRSFHHVSGLSRHLVTHAGVTFACKECGRQFNDRSAVQRHVQNVHKLKDSGGDSATEGNGNDAEFD